MTNAEKFKEVFGIDFEYNLENVCPRPHMGVCYYDDDGDEDCDTCVYEYWENNEYQGEPTIPLSVIEDIKSVLELLSDDADRACKASNSYSVRDRLRTKAQAYDDVAKMIDGKIKEIKHD